MLDHLGCSAGSDDVRAAVERVLVTRAPRTPDLGGSSTTREVGQAVLKALER
jgi:tartrate dehydrogenase/decarboxylase/D-malate dehydrogenase